MDNKHLDKDGNPKLKFEVKMRMKEGGLEKAIFIDGELLDWAVDAQSLIEAMKMGPHFYKEIQRDIERHFVESVSEVVGRHLTPQDIKTAIATGWI